MCEIKNVCRCAAALLAMLLGTAASHAENFSEVFCDSTLRLDCVFSGTPGSASIALASAQMQAGWPGRTTNLDSLLYGGNGDVTLVSAKGDTIYRNSFSSLFYEWMELGESEPVAMQHTVLTPMPKDSTIATVRLFDKWHRPIAELKKTISPTDILIRRFSQPSLPHEVIHSGSYAGTKIKVAFLAEGYTAEEMDSFIVDCKNVVDAILSHEPFASYSDRFDFTAVLSPSADSGVSQPLQGQWKDTAFKSHYSTFYSDRYLTSPEVWAMHDAIRGVGADHIMVLANCDQYGGGGIFNSYTLTTARNPQARAVSVHEFGHSFGGLADEYFYDEDAMDGLYPTTVEPWEPNITTLVDFDSKWAHLINKDTAIPTSDADCPIGAFEGGGYAKTGVYRPADICRMRVNQAEGFCPACRDALKNIILFYTE